MRSKRTWDEFAGSWSLVLWLLATATLAAGLIAFFVHEHVGAPPALGVGAGFAALAAWLGVDRSLRRLSPRWGGFWRAAGRASPIAIALGIFIVSATLVYGVAYLSTGNKDLARIGHHIDFEGPVRDDGHPAFYMSAVFRVSDVDGCDEPVSVELAAFPSPGTPEQVRADPAFFSLTMAAVDAVGSPSFDTLEPRNGRPVPVRSDAVLEQVADDSRLPPARDRIEGRIAKKAWTRSPVIARFRSDLLEHRSANSCYLVLPLFPDESRGPLAPEEVDERRLESWARVEVQPDLSVDAEASDPPPDRDYNGRPVWKCERQRGACYGVAVIEKKDTEDLRDLNLLAMGLLLSLGSAALLEGLLDGLRRAAR